MAAATVERVVEERGVGEEPDARLLQRFAAGRDEAAFAELVRRHGRLVWGVCRRRLARREDAEDAFQATFLILAVKAGSVRRGEALPGWLHRTACRAAVRVASTAPAGGPAEETASTGRDAFAELARYEAAVAVDEELVRLPRRYRDPLVLFHLEEFDRKEVAARLGASETTVKALLARGRALLRTRLARRGVAVPLVLPFVADPVPAEAAASACRLGLSVTRGGVSALDLVSVSSGGGGVMIGWMIGKTVGAGVVGAACLTLFLAARDPEGKAAGPDEGQAPVDTTIAVPAADAAVTQPGPTNGEMVLSSPPGGLSMGPPSRLFEELPIRFTTRAEDLIQAALGQETKLEFPNVPLREAIAFLADSHDIKVIIDEMSLTEAGVNIDDPVDIVLDGITLRSALEILFEPHDLTYVIEDEVMKITTQDKALRKVETAAYDISTVPGAVGDEAFGDKIEQLLAPQTGDKWTNDPKIPKPRLVSFGDRLVVTGSRAYHERLDEVLSLLRARRSGATNGP